jgi:outer membrane protein insertion porin family/translocation and assembly module TamA
MPAGVVWTALVAATLLGAPRPAGAQLNRPEVAKVRFEGNHAFPADSLSHAIVTRATECRSAFFKPFCWAGAEFSLQRAYFPRRDFPLDQLRLERWYFLRGYREAAVDTTVVTLPDGRVDVTFRITEGEPVLVDSLEFTGAEDLDGADLLRDLPIRRGVPLNAVTLDEARDTLIRRLADRGYAHADVLRNSLIPTDAPHRARVTYDIAPGPLSHYGHVSVEGNRSLTEATVLRTLQFRSGDVYRLDQLEDAQARLFGLEIVRSATIRPDLENPSDSVIPLAVRIDEGDAHRVRTGAGWSSSECLDVDSRWVSRNFHGGGRRLQVRARVSNVLAQGFEQLLCWHSGTGEFGKLNWIASADFSQPWVFSTRNSFQASLYAERSSLPDSYVRKAIGARLSLTRNIGPRTPLTLSYRPELSQLDAAEVLFCTDFLVCTPQDISTLQGAHWLAPVGLTFTRVTTDNVLNPTRGYQTLVDLEHADVVTGSNFTYSRVVAETSRYVRLVDGTVLAGRLRAGWVGGGGFNQLLDRQSESLVHPQRRFFAGGANSVRGFAQNRLGPRVLQVQDVQALLQPVSAQGAGCTPDAVVDLSCDASPLGDRGFLPRPTGGTRVVEGNLEVRVPVGRRFEGAAFTDFGQVWDAQAAV